MPEDTADQGSFAEASRDDLMNRIGELEAERQELEFERQELESERQKLQAELDTITGRALDRWLSVEEYESNAVASMQQTLSWKVTKPLRLVREAQLNRQGAAARRGRA